MTEYDYIVVGGGAAGCAVAGRLSEDGRYAVLLLEAGPDWQDIMMKMPAGFYKTYADPRTNWSYMSEPLRAAGGRQIPIPRGRVLGGSSSINGMAFLRGHPKDYDGWEAGGASGWSYADCLPYFKKLENSDQGANEYRGASGPIYLEKAKMKNRLFDTFLSATENAGYARTPDINGAQPEGFGRVDVNRHRGRRWSAADGYIRAAGKRRNLRVTTDAPARRVLFSGTRATGVEYSMRGVPKQARARREVIVCGGSYNSPHLLMLSGVGPADHLAKHGIPVVVDLPSVGQNLQDHTQIYLQYTTREQVSLAWLGTNWGKAIAGSRWILTKGGPVASNMYEVCGFLDSSGEAPYPDLQLHLCPMLTEIGPTGMVLHDGVQVIISPMRPQGRGSVRLRSANPSDNPVLTFGHLDSDADMATFLNGMDRVRQIMATNPMGSLVRDEVSPAISRGTLQERIEFVRNSILSIHHPCGTCRMGSDDLAVVDSELRVRGLEGLRVVDASVMPTVVSANTHAASIMIGEKGAAHILQDAQ